MKVLKIIIMWTWQLPQSLVGLGVYLWYRKGINVGKFNRKDGGCSCLIPSNAYISGCALGYFIFLKEWNTANDFRHEKGHVMQGHILGWLYLLVVGVPSMINNIVSRIQDKRGLPWEEISLMYYTKYPEAWADRLGGVDRGSKWQ